MPHGRHEIEHGTQQLVYARLSLLASGWDIYGIRHPWERLAELHPNLLQFHRQALRAQHHTIPWVSRHFSRATGVSDEFTLRIAEVRIHQPLWLAGVRFHGNVRSRWMWCRLDGLRWQSGFDETRLARIERTYPFGPRLQPTMTSNELAGLR